MVQKVTNEDPQTRLNEAVGELRQLNEYAFSLLKASEQKVNIYSLGREAYLLGLFLSAIAQVQGIICLAENRQFRVSASQVRTLYEIWVNVRFIYCARTHLYARFMVAVSERDRLKTLALLRDSGDITEDEYKDHENRLDRLLKWLEKVYPRWPESIPDVVSPTGTPPAKRTKGLDLLARCRAIDYYNMKHHRGSKKSISMVDHYKRLYPHFSRGTHADPIELSSIFKDKGEAMLIDIDGSSDPDNMWRLLDATYAWQYDLISMTKYHILKERPPKMPSWIDMYARDIQLIK